MANPKLYSVPGQGVRMRPHRTTNGIGQQESESISELTPEPSLDSTPEPTPEPTPIPKRRRKGDEDDQ